jgi:hypothetical protein
MAATKKPLTLAKLTATVEKMRATHAKELKEIRDKALKNEQDSRKLAIAADREAQRLEEMLKTIAGMAEELQRTLTTTQPPAKKTKA